MSSRGILISYVVLAGLLAGCTEEISPRAAQELSAGTQAYQAGDYAQAIRHANAVLQDTGSGEAASQAWYLRGMARYQQDEIPAAEGDLQAALDETDDDTLAAKAADALGEIAYRQDDLQAAMAHFQTVLDRGQAKQPPTDHAHFRLGSIYQRQSRWADADLHFQRVIYEFPAGELVPLARQRSGARHWTIQAGSYAQRDNAAAAAKLFPVTAPQRTLEPVIRDGQRVYLLLVGKWTTYDQAEASLASVRQIKPDAFLSVVR